MNELLLYAAVFIGAAIPAFEVWAAVPLGVIAGLPWIPEVWIGFIVNLITSLPVVYDGDKMKAWSSSLRKKPSADEVNETDDRESPNARKSRKRRIFERFGVPGLAFLGPFLIGVHIASAFAIASGASRQTVIIWFSISIFVCAFLSGLLAEMGVANFAGDATLPFQGD